MSKVSFRARALDANRILPIFREEDLVDLNECNSINRTVPQMPTGMEKDEESEHHLQEALNAWQRDKTTEYVAIPIPEIHQVEARYVTNYPESFQISKQFFNMQPILLADEETIDYDMDTEDEDCLNNMSRDKKITPLQFESIMDKLEKSSGIKVVSLKEALLLIKDVEEELVIAVYDFWLNKRLKHKSPLILTVKPERRDGGSANDPYVAFRKRTEKMQTRKNRKNDIQSFERMLTLRHHFVKLMDILSMINQREVIKRQSISTRQKIYTARLKASDWDGSCLAQADLKAGKSHSHNLRHFSGGTWKDEEIIEKDEQTRRKRDARKRKNRTGRPRGLSMSSSVGANVDSSGDEDSSAESLSDPDGQFSFKRMPGCHYHSVHDAGFPESSECVRKSSSFWWKGSYHLTTVTNVIHHNHSSTTGYFRQRVGRGGRRIFERKLASRSSENFLGHWNDEHSKFSRRDSMCGYSEDLSDSSECVIEEDWTVDDTQSCYPQLCSLPSAPFVLKDKGSPDDSNEYTNTPLFLPASPRHSNNNHSQIQRLSDPRPQSHPSIRPHHSPVRPRESIEASPTTLVRHMPSPLMARSSYAFTSSKKEGSTTRVIVTSPPNNSLVSRVGGAIRVNGANPISRSSEMRPPTDGPVTYMVVRSSSSGSSATPASNMAGSGVPPRKIMKVPSGAPSSGSSQISPGVVSQQQRAGTFSPRSNNAMHGVLQRGIPGRGNKRKRVDFLPGMTSDGDT